ncbi:hypothetical protein BCR36DRAFT_445949, partial [Piromyces finnis]
YLLLNTMLVLSSSVKELMNKMINYEEICDIHNTDITDNQLKEMVSSGFEYIINSVSISNNATTSDEVYNIRQAVVEEFEEKLYEADLGYTGTKSLVARGDDCDWKKLFVCAAYTAGITIYLALYGFGPFTGPEAIACIIGIGPSALKCYSDCF